ncbi:hypothetical protein [Longispora albida]|uniref:hypothetical protein n=1 Tax=Longispora albida TaxID=203523 RepID=UPI0003679B9D|nr:hypothetical protein [Longispora albida]
MTTHMISTPALPHTCPRCRVLVLAGVAEGVPVHADPQPVTPAGELDAVLAGRSTYSIVGRELVRRDAGRAASLSGAVVVDHQCGQPIAAGHHAPAVLPVPQQRQPRELDPDATRVRGHLVRNGPDYLFGVAVRLGMSVETTEAALRRLLDAGQVERGTQIPAPWRAVPVDQIPPF